MSLKTVIRTLCLTITLRYFVFTRDSNSTSSSEYDLHLELFSKYNSDIRPVRRSKDAVNVVMKIYIYTIEDLDEKQQTVSMRCWSEIKWNDQFLVWKPEDFNNITRIDVPTGRIWLPDLALRLSTVRLTDIGQEEARALIFSDGSVVMWPAKVLTVGCKFRIKYYPFDAQYCTYMFLTWINPSSKVTLKWGTETASYGYYWESNEWRVDDINLGRRDNLYEADPWDRIAYEITLRRKPLFYVLNLLAPIVLISLLNALCFLLPAESDEKITLSISIFLALSVFLTIVNSLLPESSDEVSIFGVYVGLQFIGSGCTVMATVISLNLFHRNQNNAVPKWLQFIAGCVYENNAKSKIPESDICIIHKEELSGEAGEDNSSPRKKRCCFGMKQEMSWQQVSRAFDRVCFWLSLVWHVTLLLNLAISVHFPEE